MEPQDTCTQSQQLTDLIQGLLSDEKDAMLREHVEVCSACQEELQRLVGADETADSVSDHLRKPRGTSDSALLDVIDRLKTPPWEDQAEAEEPEGDLPLDFLDPSDEPNSLGRLAQYEITEVAGQGGMGIVLKGIDTKLSRVVAVKVLAPVLASNPTARRRFLREAKAAAAVSHDHVVTIYAVDEACLPYLVMEFIDGQSLQQKIDRQGQLSLKEILRIGRQVAAGLAAAHEQGIIHRDIKPSNILLQNGIERVQITDFGLARAVDDVRITRTGDVAGTPQYMSPEQAQGLPTDHRADLFSLGSVLYAMCTGRSPFRAESTLAVIRRVCDDTPRPVREVNPEISPWLAEIIDRLLAKAPEDRFQTAAEVSDLLGRHLAHVQDPDSTPPPGSIAAVPGRNGRSRRRRWLLAVAILLVVIGGVGLTEATGVTQFAATVIRIATGEGTLVIEVADPTVRISIDGEEVSIQGAGIEELRLRPGQYRFKATKDGQPVKTELVTITRGGRQVVKVTKYSPVLSDAKPQWTIPPSPLQKPIYLEPGAPPLAVAPFDAQQAQQHQEAWADYLSLPVEREIELPGGAHLTLLLIPPGEFMMGSPEAERRLALEAAKTAKKTWAIAQIPTEGPRHAVRISRPFYLGKYEVTQSQWEAVMGDNPSSTKDPMNPVEQVSWQHIQAFLAKLNAASMKEGMKFVLPTEAQWEYACRAGTATTYYFGEDTAVLGQYAWYFENSGRKRHPVGEKNPNGWGLHDMHGNVWEWCADWRADYYSQSPPIDPIGPKTGVVRVLRGGCVADYAWSLRSAPRVGNEPDFHCPDYGFRVALEPLESSPVADAQTRPVLPKGVSVVKQSRVLGRHKDGVYAVAFSSDGRSALSGGGYLYPEWTDGSDFAIRLWDVESGREVRRFEGHTGQVFSLVFAPDGRRFLSTSNDGTVRLWDLASGKQLKRVDALPAFIRSLALFPDGRRFVVGGTRDVQIWDLESGQKLQHWRDHAEIAYGVCVSPDGRFVLCGLGEARLGSLTGSLILYDVDSGDKLWEHQGAGEIRSVFFLGDGQEAMSAGLGRPAQVWDVATGKLLRTFPVSTEGALATAVSPDERFVLAAGFNPPNSCLRVWNLQTGKLEALLESHTVASGVAISPDGRLGLSVGADGAVRLWELPQSVWPTELQSADEPEPMTTEAQQSDDEMPIDAREAMKTREPEDKAPKSEAPSNEEIPEEEKPEGTDQEPAEPHGQPTDP